MPGNLKAALGAFAGGGLALILAVSGCGSSSSPAAKLQLHATPNRLLSNTIDLSSPALAHGHTIPVRYTCDGEDVSLPVSWSNLPAKTAELAMFLFTGVLSGGKLGIVSVDWGIVGLKPTLRGLASNEIPTGAVLGRGENGSSKYSICPSSDSGSYAVVLYALPRRLPAKSGFDARTLRRQAASQALAGGVLIANYRRARPALSIPVAATTIPARYTCEGGNTSLPLLWRNIPGHTAELALFLARTATGRENIVYDWAVAGLKASLGGLAAGKLPPGAIVARNSFGQIGYSVCPPKGSSSKYIAILLTLPRRLTPKQGFDPGTFLKAALRGAKTLSTAQTSYIRP
jgi:phosphatidylethanolamine-binding protein (PEBP) family uncharacterized protein